LREIKNNNSALNMKGQDKYGYYYSKKTYQQPTHHSYPAQ
jgi:hypothetical protein